MKEILPNVFAAEIDFDATEVQITHHAIAFKSETSNLPTDTNGFRYIEIGLGKLREFEVLGTVTETEISFDVEPYVESTEIDVEQYDGIFVATPRFWDYELESFSCSGDVESFRSALTANDFHFVNPMGEEQRSYSELMDGVNRDELADDMAEWSKHQSNLVKKLLILKRK